MPVRWVRHVFVPIKVTTEYSLMKSLITVPKLMEYLLQNKIEVCGICDTNLYGVMEFYLACQKNHIKPLIGLEVFLGEISLYLYARDYTGYLDLLKIHTLVEKKELSMVALEMVESHLNIILPYAYSSHFKELMDKFQHLYLGYTTELEKNNSYLFTENAVYTQNICCFQKKDGTYLNLLKAIEENESVKSLPKENYEKNSFEEARLMEEDSSDFVSSISIEFPKPTRHIPKFDENNKDSYAYLCALAKKGLQKRMNQKVSKEAQERLQKELEVIHKMGFADYFLIVYDYVFFAKKNHILVGIGRGSAVGSLVSYCLGITDVNPLDYNLLFERFLNPERVTMPDIDIDFEEERRSEVISYVKEKYGEEKVAGIMTFGTLKSKLVLKSVAKALDMNSSVIEKFLSLIDPKLTLKENLQNNSISYYVKNNPDILKLYQISMKLEGLKRHISTHAAGIVISSNTLDEIIPIHYNGTELLTGVGMNYLEDLGLLKMDFLSLKNLSIISSILRLIEEHTNTKINLNKIDLNDSKVLHLFEVADTAGVFQFESEGMKNFLKKLKPKAFSDLIAAIALFRPGPMENIDTFIKRKEGKEKISYLHQDLEPILKETYGIIVYQEQVMQILVVIGGFSFAEADIIRRAMSKKKKEIIDEYEEKFMIGAKQKHYDEKLARDIYALILKFANYGFNKSHSVSYALIGYQMAYLKCYYKVYFIANLLNRNTLSVEKTKEYMALGKQAGITFLRPDINFSEENYKIENNTLRLPLALIKNLGSEGTKTILEERKKGLFKDFIDFVCRCYQKSINKKTLEFLIHAGCFDSFAINHRTLIENIDAIINYATLTNGMEGMLTLRPVMEEYPDLSKEMKEKEELDAFGFYLSNHPSSAYQGKQYLKLNSIASSYNRYVKCVVLIDSIREIQTKEGKPMAFVHVSDETGETTLVAFPSTMDLIRKIRIGDFVLTTGRVARRMADYQINIQNIQKIERKENQKGV